MSSEHPQVNHVPRIVLSWALVAIPLGYGLFQTLKAVSKLFTGG